MVAFEFLLPDLLPLYSCILNWMKVFSESSEALIRGVILTRPGEVYNWKKTVNNNNVYIEILLQRDESTVLELKFNYDNFNKLVQALYFLTWQAMCLKDHEIEILLNVIPLPFAELFEFKDSSKVILFLRKVTKRPYFFSFIVEYHLETLFFLHKIYRIINNESIHERLNLLCAS